MIDVRKRLGAKNEEVASAYLRKKGFKIIDRNVHCGRLGEIDIIAKDRSYLVFVEVKSRRSQQYGTPEYSVDWKKQRKLIRLAQWYLKSQKLQNIPCRFDVISILCPEDSPPKIRHFPHAFKS